MRTYQRSEPPKTPNLIKQLILLTASLSVFSNLFEIFIQEVFRTGGPLTYLSLNPELVANGFIYQPLSYLFVYGKIGAEITFGWLFGLLLLLYLLWVLGSDLVERMGAKKFLTFYLSLGIFSGIMTCLFAYLFGIRGNLAGPTAALLGSLLLWLMFNKESKLFVFFLFSIQAKWLTAIIFGYFLLTSMNSYDSLYFLSYVFGIAGAWIYGLIVWQLHTPYSFLQPIENVILRNTGTLSSFFRKKEGKIIDFRTGEEISDEDRFMDEMLDKIHTKGKASLSFFERWRMHRISKRKNKS